MFAPENLTDQLRAHIEMLPKTKIMEKYVASAEEIYILKFIDEDFYEATKTAFLANTSSADETKFCKYLQKSIANYAFILAIPNLVAQFGDGGMTKANADLVQTASEEDYYTRKIEAVKIADYYLDKSLAFAYKNLASYPKESTNNKFLKHFTDFETQLGINISARLFKNIQADIDYAQKKYIETILTEQTITALHTAFINNTLTEIQNKTYKAIQKILALAAVCTYLPKNAVSLIENSLSLFSMDFRGLQTKKEDWKIIEKLILRLKEELDFTYGNLISLVKQNPTEFPDQPTETTDTEINTIENGKIIFL